MLPPSPKDFRDIYVVFELLETDLHQVSSRQVGVWVGGILMTRRLELDVLKLGGIGWSARVFRAIGLAQE